MFNLFALRTNYWKNGTQWMGKWVARAIGNLLIKYIHIIKPLT